MTNYKQTAHAATGPAAAPMDAGAARIDAGSGTTSGSPVVTDTSAVASDVGKPVTGAGIPAGTVIVAVNPGVGFTMSANATATASVPVTVTSTYGCFYMRVVSPAPDSSVALETSPDGTTWTQQSTVRGDGWCFARSDHRIRAARSNVVSLGTGGAPISAIITSGP